MATPCGMTGAQQAASGYALSALLRIKNLHHFQGHYPNGPEGASKTPICTHYGVRHGLPEPLYGNHLCTAGRPAARQASLWAASLAGPIPCSVQPAPRPVQLGTVIIQVTKAGRIRRLCRTDPLLNSTSPENAAKQASGDNEKMPAESADGKAAGSVFAPSLTLKSGKLLNSFKLGSASPLARAHATKPVSG